MTNIITLRHFVTRHTSARVIATNQMLGVAAASCNRHNISTLVGALHLLDLKERPSSPKLLRVAYFQAAKNCHPDSPQARALLREGDKSDEEVEIMLTTQFLKLTQAYEFLQANIYKHYDGDDDVVLDQDIISYREEQDFREACQDVLGLSAETVEECKKCPLFREWLKGRTEGAGLWRRFFTQHGGLAPKLPVREEQFLLEESANARPMRRKRHS
mmetsp:Transcript_4152/g.6268  ORF Transcript_4152/g.6268 Transcript_4152/m.6268 type:complete len:216 (+) Transcript_4152:59-706(+)